MSLPIHSGASRRRLAILTIAAAALLAVDAGVASAQASGSSSARAVGESRDARGRRERLLLRFDSLRNVFEHQRLSSAEREALAAEMHDVMMALQESLTDVSVEVRAANAARAQARGQTVVIARRRDDSRGYLGLSFDGPSVDERRGGERVIRFLDYPRIVLVEPSSPAERAGILEGDTLVALNGSDVRDKYFSLTRLLVPDRRIRVRVRRDGTPMDFRLTVAEAPGYVMSRMTPMPPMAAMAPPPPTTVRIYSGEALPRVPTPAAVAPTPAPAIAFGGGWVMQEGVAGARLESITEGLGRALGTRYGVLVLRAAPGTPAFESGLRDGDVIVRAGGDAVRSIRELRQALLDADGEDGVRLVVLREKKQRELQLRW